MNLSIVQFIKTIKIADSQLVSGTDRGRKEMGGTMWLDCEQLTEVGGLGGLTCVVGE